MSVMPELVDADQRRKEIAGLLGALRSAERYPNGSVQFPPPVRIKSVAARRPALHTAPGSASERGLYVDQ